MSRSGGKAGAKQRRRLLIVSQWFDPEPTFKGLAFARSLGEFGATITFVSNIPGETRTLPLAIYGALQVPGSEAVVTRLSIIAVALSLLALVASELLARRAGHGRGGHVI